MHRTTNLARASGAAIRGVADACLAIGLAPACAACDRLLESPTRGCVCAACWAGISRLTPPLCTHCGDPLPSWRAAAIAGGVCARCRRIATALDRGRAAGRYEGSLRAIVHALKYDGRRSLARPLAALMRHQAGDLLQEVDWAVPVPLHWRRRRQRGFNQAHDLARGLGVPVRHALRRVRATRPQADLPAARRHRNVRDAFALSRGAWWGWPSPLDGACVLLVDDVSTTGATLDACARVLKAAGVREVRALTAARVVTRPRP